MTKSQLFYVVLFLILVGRYPGTFIFYCDRELPYKLLMLDELLLEANLRQKTKSENALKDHNFKGLKKD